MSGGFGGIGGTGGTGGFENYEGPGYAGGSGGSGGYEGLESFEGEGFVGLRTRLAELADSPAPASPFDPVRTAATGRRRVLAVRGSTVAGGAALVVALVLGVVTAFAPAAQTSQASAAPGLGGDPMVKYFDYGWLPASLPNVSYIATSDYKGDDVVAQGDYAPSGVPRVDLQLLSGGDGPGTPKADERLISVKLNDGRAAYWLTQAQPRGEFAGDVQLRFAAADGRWFSMTWSVNWGQNLDDSKIAGVPWSSTAGGLLAGGTGHGASGNGGTSNDGTAPTSVPLSVEWQQNLLHMATDATDMPAQVPMPLRLTGLPDDFQPEMATLWRPGPGRADGQFGEGAPGSWIVVLSFDRDVSGADLEVGPHGTLGDTSHAECVTSAGLDACVWHGGKSAGYDRVGGSKGLLKLVTLLGLDEKSWTTDVLVP